MSGMVEFRNVIISLCRDGINRRRVVCIMPPENISGFSSLKIPEVLAINMNIYCYFRKTRQISVENGHCGSLLPYYESDKQLQTFRLITLGYVPSFLHFLCTSYMKANYEDQHLYLLSLEYAFVITCNQSLSD